MALKKAQDPVQDILGRFNIAQTAPVPDNIEARKDVQWLVQQKVLAAANLMNGRIKDSRELSLTLTHLEEALMWAGKAIYS